MLDPDGRATTAAPRFTVSGVIIMTSFAGGVLWMLGACAAIVIGEASKSPAERAAEDRAVREAVYNQRRDAERDAFWQAATRAAEEADFERDRRARTR